MSRVFHFMFLQDTLQNLIKFVNYSDKLLPIAKIVKFPQKLPHQAKNLRSIINSVQTASAHSHPTQDIVGQSSELKAQIHNPTFIGTNHDIFQEAIYLLLSHVHEVRDLRAREKLSHAKLLDEAPIRAIWGGDKIRAFVQEVLGGSKVGSVTEIEVVGFHHFFGNLVVGDNYAC